MIAVFDCGNSGIKAGLFKKNRLVASFRIDDKPKNAAADLFLANSVFSEQSKNGDGAIRPAEIRAVVISAVTKTGKESAAAIAARLGLDPFHINPAAFLSAGGFSHNYKASGQLGADRLCSAVGAAKRYRGKNCIIADFGTALTIDAVAKGECFMGGIITAGFHTLADSLQAKFLNLSVSKPEKTEIFCGTSTEECFSAGMFLTISGACRESIAALERTCFHGQKALHIACGGDSHYFNDTGIFDAFHDNLVLEGALEILTGNLKYETLPEGKMGSYF